MSARGSDPASKGNGSPATQAGTSLLEARSIVQEFDVRGRGGIKDGTVRAVSGVSIEVHVGETLGVVGETGSGKSTLARSLMQAPRPKSGEVVFQGVDLTKLRGRDLLRARRQLQMVLQDPFGSLDPKWRVARIVQEPLAAYRVGTKEERRNRVSELLQRVGLEPRIFGGRRPGELSGGQAQRVAIARALALNPSLIVCDEAVSALDVQVQAQVLNLFEELRSEFALSYLFIAHDLALVKQISDRVAVMYLGKICEVGPATDLYRAPLHPYTQALVSSIPNPRIDARRQRSERAISGELPSPLDPPSGCRFRTRCPRAENRCSEEEPPPRDVAPGRTVACHFPLGVAPVGGDGGGDLSGRDAAR